MKNILSISTLLLILSACGTTEPELPTLDLLEHGMPLSIQAPADAKVTKAKIAFRQELKITAEDNFKVVIAMDDAVSRDPQKIKEQRLTAAKEHRFFFRVVEDEPHGFIFENRIDSSNSTYGFTAVKVLGDKEYVFENARTGIYTLEQIERMYDAVTDDKE